VGRQNLNGLTVNVLQNGAGDTEMAHGDDRRKREEIYETPSDRATTSRERKEQTVIKSCTEPLFYALKALSLGNTCLL
jgi:hypothetical protein